MSWTPDIVIYHSPCDDGFAAAWAAYKRWGSVPEYFPTHYGARPPEVLGKNVLIVDFSYKREGIDTCLQGAASVVILDHHKTAAAELAPFVFHESSPGAVSADDVPGMLRDLAELGRPPCIALFDMQRSGAAMTWQFCHPDTELPWLVMLVQDRDLWRFEHDQTEAFSHYLRSLPYNFSDWDDVSERLEVPDEHSALMDEARAIQRFYARQVEKLVGTWEWMTIDGHKVPAVNCPGEFASEVGHALLELVPCPFAATWSARHGGIGYSLRSLDDRMDVSAIARRYGGGGHRNAAGFEVPKC